MKETRIVQARPEPEKKNHHVKRVFVWALEIAAVAVSYFQSSAIVRFITAKISMDVVVEVTAAFGTAAGHNLSTFLSAIVAEPRLIAVILAAIILVIDLIVWIAGSIVRTSRRHRQRREAINDDYRYLSYGTPEAASRFGIPENARPANLENARRAHTAAGEPRADDAFAGGRPASSREIQETGSSSGQVDPYDVSYLGGQTQSRGRSHPQDAYDVSYLQNPQDHTPL